MLRGVGDEVVVAALVNAMGPVVPSATYQLMQTSEPSAGAIAASLSAQVDVVLIQHEFGIFGGPEASVLQALTDNLTVPYVITLHAVLEQFRSWQAAALGGTNCRPYRRTVEHLFSILHPALRRQRISTSGEGPRQGSKAASSPR